MPLDHDSLEILARALKKLDAGFSRLPEFSPASAGAERMREVLVTLAEKLQDNYPYFHPLYAGQMLKPPHPVARLAYSLAMYINPNNHALDGGRATSDLEKEAVAEIAAVFGWKEFLGHLCGGGTMANLEALWVAGRIHPMKIVLASDQAHYTHGRISSVLQLPFEKVECDSHGRMDMNELAKRVARGDVGTVVATLGTTATGSVDPLVEILELREKFGFRVHADAAYFAIREWGSCISTIRRTRISVPRNCIWAKSVWNVRGRERQLLRCGRRRSCCRSRERESLQKVWNAAGKQGCNFLVP